MSNDLFIVASRKRYRFESGRGELTVENLWDLSLTSLDTIAKALNRKLKESAEESFIATPTTRKNTELENKLEILKYVIGVKQAELEKSKKAAAKSAQIAQLRELAATKANEALSAKSLEDIEKMIAELEAEQ